MSARITEENDSILLELPCPILLELPCPVCIEAAAEKNEGLVPECALQRYSLAQLKTHLETNIHNQKDFVSVAIRASIHLYRQACIHGFREIGL
jgi:hypothetical protein